MIISYFKKLIRINIIVLLFLTSCSKEVSLSTGEQHVVVECILSCDSVQTMKLSLSHAKDGNSSSLPITDANVTLFDETLNETAGTFHYFGGKDWKLNYAAEPEHAYRLDIDVKGHEHISAQQTMPKLANLNGGIGWGAGYSDNLMCHKYGESFHGTCFGVNALPAKTWIYAICYDEGTGETHIADEICSDFPFIDNFNLTSETYVPYIVEFETLVGLYPVKICNYLTGYPLYKRYMRTNADLVDPEESEYQVFIISGSFYYYDNPNRAQPLGSKGGVYFTTVSEDYDRYLLEAVYYQQQQESDDMTTIYKRDNIFSNIKGGIGIFGAKTEFRSNWVMDAYGKNITY